MIKTIKLKDFRSFSNWSFKLEKGINIISWENWKWKTNFLEAIHILCTGEPFSDITFDNLVNFESKDEVFFIWWDFIWENTFNSINVSFSKKENKKKFFVNKKPTIKKKIIENSFPCVVFSPINMNMLYLSPSLRRDFLDKALMSSSESYKKTLLNYNKILKSRNKLLKNIAEKKSDKSELSFWNKQLIDSIFEIYKNRKDFIIFIKNKIVKEEKYFPWKNFKVEFIYNSKIAITSEKKDIEKKIKDLEEKEVLASRTLIWPHLDDFEILLNWNNSAQIASRWENKSMILWLKIIESDYIEQKRLKKPILLIDDLVSELDEKHRSLLLNEVENYQTIISSISPLNKENINSISL